MKISVIGIPALALALLGSCDKPAPVTAPVPPVEATTQPAAATSTNNADGEAVKATLEKIFELAKNGDCAGMAPLLAVNHSNTADDYKRGLRYDSPSEKVMVDKQCAQLQVMMADIKDHTFKEFAQETESEGEWNVWVLDMRYNDGSTEERTFAFLKNGNGYILGDIDG